LIGFCPVRSEMGGTASDLAPPPMPGNADGAETSHDEYADVGASPQPQRHSWQPWFVAPDPASLPQSFENLMKVKMHIANYNKLLILLPKS
jgi:hypothetical protein